ncbi:MAG TPA: DNA-processing protein DprA [Gemmatimonadaceae bacterium]
MSDPTLQPLCPERRDALALSLVYNIGSLRSRELRAQFGSAARALDDAFDVAVAREARERADAALTRARRGPLELLLDSDEAYPQSLHDLPDPPPALWALGSLDTLKRPVVAIVGTRRATHYGQRMARELAGAFARAGACVVSGMALGIDATAHRAALDNGGHTVAVLGTGADVAYPPAHRALHREIASRGLVISELLPGEHSHGGSFPNRNRIIAALAKVTIVVEAPIKSGALITARHAAGLPNAVVACVPGPIDSPQSEGTNLLIRDGAQIICSVADALALAGLTPPLRSSPAMAGEAEQRVWSALANGAASLDELCSRTGLPVQDCLTAVTTLEIQGAIECCLTGEIRRR